MTVIEIGTKLVDLCNADAALEAVETLYDEKIVSIEAQGTDELPAVMEGIEAIKQKNSWWYDNHEVHESKAVGPFCGHREDQFAVYFEIDVTNKPTGQRTQMTEIGLYTVADDKIVQEEFLYLMR